MMCSNPYIGLNGNKGIALNRAKAGKRDASQIPFPCGQCFNCRINKSRVWATRMYLENFDHVKSSFVTLTYNDDYLPIDRSLKPKHLTNFFKRLRFNFGEKDWFDAECCKYPQFKSFRYFACGEYGEKEGRPHYHIAMFGINGEEKEDIEKAWSIENNPIGIVHIGDLNKNSIRYISGYIMKGANKYVDLSYAKDRKAAERINEHLGGRHPEFQRMSRQPGIGAKAIERIAKTAKGKTETFRKITIDGREVFIGKFLRSKSDKVLQYDIGDNDDFYDYVNELFSDTQYYGGSYYDNIRRRSRQGRKNRLSRWKIFNNNGERKEL